MGCDSRIKFSEFLSFDTRFPVILKRKYSVTKLSVKHCHELGGHCCTNHAIAPMWKNTGLYLEEIRERVNECSECRRLQARTAKQIMADDTQPFIHGQDGG